MTESTETIYRVVISDEGRYSIWPEFKEIPWGWRAEGKQGSKQECLDYIAEVWTDMRPLSLQKIMATPPQEEQSTND
ncbi:MbtH family NRPS accessory protein [Acaryochloris sp. IP29b_bin.137]|uniref:MbtH family protein n=1 Tax=Acaryochloris sp. IP29b_bin.137 TaxID=2969217 RepID=UPI00262F90AA|nr:MbtH family NRPS accessory protein [Acaryochloris sp. IP29b_bin.137]